MSNLIDITCSKASTNKTTVVKNCNLEQMTIEDFRKKLEEVNFISTEETTEQWRFVFSNVIHKGTEKPKYSDRVVGLNSEMYIPIKQVLIGNPPREIVITNTARIRSIDLIGYTANWFAGGNLRVKASLTGSANNQGKFEPVMLTDVISTNDALALYYSNVCIFCEDSEVSFTLRSFGTMGFMYKATLQSGAVLRDSAVRWPSNTYDVFGQTKFSAWQGSDRAIVMKAIENVSGIDPATKLSYMLANFRATDMTAWRDWGVNPNVIHRKPAPVPRAESNKAGSLASVKTLDSSISGKDQRIVDGEDIRPVTPTEGEKIAVGYGKWYREEWRPWEQSQDGLDIYFFGFKTLDAAKKYFDRYNYLPLHAQGTIWEV